MKHVAKTTLRVTDGVYQSFDGALKVARKKIVLVAMVELVEQSECQRIGRGNTDICHRGSLIVEVADCVKEPTESGGYIQRKNRSGT